MKVPRIALSGSAGTGKTTLGRRLASALGVPYIEEGMRRRLEAGLQMHHLERREHLSLMDELWREQCAAQAAAREGFVADRSAFDFAAFWLHYGFHGDLPESADRFETWCAAGRDLGPVLLFPWGVLPLEADGVRSADRFTQLRFQGILEGVLGEFAAPGQIARVPRTADLEERLRFVLQRV